MIRRGGDSLKAPEKFNKNVIEKSESKVLVDALQGEFIEAEYHRVLQGEEIKCACGKDLRVGWKVYYVWNVKNKEFLTIGSCCIHKCPRLHHWKSKEEYLYNALKMARNPNEAEFVQRQINKLPKWGSSLIMSPGAAKWLKDITGKEWRWKVWKRSKRRATKSV